MNINLTAKERTLLEDQKSHEEICIQKYSNYANMVSDPQLKEMFKNHANIEQQHLNSINQLLSGQMPGVGGPQSGGVGSSWPNQSLVNYRSQGSFSANRASDKDLCTDMLMTEKYVS
ncbi:MAG TPA: spore coat protein, partial [Bacillota bacterium]|nr:spore coat protein [Bacillota bacterium]